MTDPAQPAGPPPRYTPNVKYVLMLGALAALPAVTTDMYLPSLPDVAADLGTSAAAAQMTMSGMLIGGAVGQLVIGPFSDRFGRRLPLLIGISLHVITSLLCSIAPSIETLIALRVIQGFFNAAASVVAIAVIRDRFTGSDAARLLSRLMLVIGVAPLFAPTIGQAIAGQWQWRAVFYALAIIGVVLVVIVWRFMPETLPKDRRRVAGPRGALASYLGLLRDRHFLALAVLPGFGMAVIMSYVVGSTFVLQEEYGMTGGQFSAIFAVNGVALVLSAQLNAHLVRKVAPIRILRVAIIAQLVLAILLLVVVVTGLGGVVGVIIGLWFVLGMQGMIPANATVIALGRYGHMAGTAAALIGAMQAGIAGVVSPFVGVFGGTAVAMTSVIIASIAVGVAILALATPAYRRGGWLAQ
ncbi:MFS transporter, DHA1 family, bicyclomycin/chloramphenicol resistance protein [Sanguibacter gelidistatuariae]|uniref:MFS transporter, DHA1 family, bicyclomycin/chloramphenicol resistance protein n=1 Tax=Sanguibacter gelidistatuariae TaxID=1814289 RepID=A0A1G6MNG2_9MICO|nr:multidrug effflux MFS transporter [Sanguibacter gelidistatuariae]SDC57128.1 MFS transporter, DHA1 family, bicyclomycin/chloramphenicol resistance protein [Sanguibacter gelidistatuariae]